MFLVLGRWLYFLTALFKNKPLTELRIVARTADGS
jgi:hypothetical protein